MLKLLNKRANIVVAFTSIFSSHGFSQQDVFEPAKSIEILQAEDRKLGWNHSESISLGANVLSSDNVIGQPDGNTTIYNLKLSLELDKIEKFSDWENRLSIDETFSTTPSSDRFIKTKDEIKLSSLYKQYFHSRPWLGFFGHLQAETHAFAGYDDQTERTEYEITRTSGVVETEIADRLKLTDPFMPLTTKESVGIVAKLIQDVEADLEFRSGPGAKQIAANKQLTVSDNEETEVIEIAEITSIRVLGWMLAAELKGKILNKKLEYRIYADALYPISYSPEEDGTPDGVKLISTELGLTAGYNIFEWMSIQYDFNTKRDPLILDKAQVSQSALLTLTYKNSSKDN